MKTVSFFKLTGVFFFGLMLLALGVYEVRAAWYVDRNGNLRVYGSREVLGWRYRPTNTPTPLPATPTSTQQEGPSLYNNQTALPDETTSETDGGFMNALFGLFAPNTPTPTAQPTQTPTPTKTPTPTPTPTNHIAPTKVATYYVSSSPEPTKTPDVPPGPDVSLPPNPENLVSFTSVDGQISLTRFDAAGNKIDLGRQSSFVIEQPKTEKPPVIEDLSDERNTSGTSSRAAMERQLIRLRMKALREADPYELPDRETIVILPSANGYSLLTKDGVGAITREQLFVDLSNNSVLVGTSSGLKPLRFMPATALDKLTEIGVLDRSLANPVMSLSLEDSLPVYVVRGTKQKMALGIFQVNIDKHITVSAENGRVFGEEQSLPDLLLELISR